MVHLTFYDIILDSATCSRVFSTILFSSLEFPRFIKFTLVYVMNGGDCGYYPFPNISLTVSAKDEIQVITDLAVWRLQQKRVSFEAPDRVNRSVDKKQFIREF